MGSVDGEAALTRVLDMTLGPEGLIYVSQPQVSHVAVFSAEGAPVDRVGRAGSGPGEFSYNPIDISWRGETSFANEQGKTIFYDLDGTFIREVSFHEPIRVPGSNLYAGTPLSDGRFLPTRALSGRTPSDLAAFVQADSVAILSIAEDGADLDTIGFVPKLRDVMVGGGLFTHPLQPLQGNARLPLRVTSDGDHIVFVSRVLPDATPPRFEVLRIGTSGDTVAVFDVPWVPKPISRADARILREGFGTMAAGDESRWSEPTRERRRREAERALVLPSYFPPVRQILPRGGWDDLAPSRTRSPGRYRALGRVRTRRSCTGMARARDRLRPEALEHSRAGAPRLS